VTTDATRAQQDEAKAQLFISLDPSQKPTDLAALLVRPNVHQPVYFSVKNAAPIELPLTVRLVAVRPEGKGEPVPVATADLGKVAKGATAPVTQWKLAAPPPPPPGQPAPPPEVDLPGPGFGLLLEVVTPRSEKPLLSKPLKLQVLEPRAYVKVTRAAYKSDPATGANVLLIQLTAVKEFQGPPCPVSLDLRPSQIPGLRPEKSKGTYEDVLTDPGQEVELTAENLRFNGKPPTTGRVFVTVDGYERAFIYQTDFIKPEATPDEVTRPDLRIAFPSPYALAARTFPVRLEVDTPPRATMSLHVGLDRNKDGKVTGRELRELPPGDRWQHVRVLPPGQDGALILQTEVRPWTVDLNSAGLFGPFEVQAWADYTTEAGERLRLQGKRTVTFDGTPPEDPLFDTDAMPRELEIGAALPVAATVHEGESPITEAIFFLGKPGPDKKLPPDTVKGLVIAPAKGDLWRATARLPIPADAKSPTLVTVQFTNAVGLSADQTITIQWKPPGAAVPVKPSISGTVFEGDRPQPDLGVILRDANGVDRDTVKTDATGKYVFKDVPPGAYRVATAKPSGSRGETAVQVVDQSKTGVDVNLTR
jgi:hypothetical protein